MADELRHGSHRTRGLAGKPHIFLGGKYRPQNANAPGRWKGKGLSTSKTIRAGQAVHDQTFHKVEYTPLKFEDIPKFTKDEQVKKLGFQRSGRLCREHCRTADQVARYRETLVAERKSADKGKEMAKKSIAESSRGHSRRPASALTGREIRKITKELRQSRVPRPARAHGRLLSDYDRTLGDAKYTFDPRASVRRQGSQVARSEPRRGSMRTSASSYGQGVWREPHKASRHSKRAANFSTAAHFTTVAFM